MVGGAKSVKELSQFKYEKLRFGNTQSSKNIVTSPNKDGKSSSDVKTGNKPSSPGSESPWLTSSKPTKNGSLANGIKRYSQQSSNSKGVSRKRVRCIVSSDEDDDVRRDNHNKKLKIEEKDQKSSPDKLENSKKDIFMLCLKFPTVQRPDIVRILRESNFNVESATVKLTALRKAKSSESPEKKNNFGSIKAFKVNRMMERMNTSNTSNNSMVSNSPNKGEGSPQVKKMKRVKVVESDSESEVKDKNADDDDLEEDKEEEKKGDPIMQGMVLSFLSSATLEELTSLNGCSKKKAESVINMRPFESWEDLDRKLEENRQLGHWLVEECQDLLKVRDNVKQLMESCQMISANLESSISDIMGGQGTHPSGGRSKCGYLVKQPAILSPGLKLTPYQMIGINWLIMMHSHKLNGILGDEMGLGKTIQTIAFLAHLLSQGNRGPHVIVCPSSTIDNWLRELQKWCPAMKVVPYYGTQEERRDLRSQLLDEGMEVNVILTSYNMASGSLEDKVLFKKYKYVYAIFDEGHMLKNMASSRYKNLTRISAERRLLLTGTPLQNNLLELISLLCFLMPDIFAGKTDHLKKIFSAAKNEKTDAVANDGRGTYVQETLKQAKRILQPFFLRRLKADVLQQLPKKTEHTLRVTLTPSQQDLYTDLMTRFMRDVTEKNPLSSGASMMMQLRKAANHELLHRKNYEDSKLKAITKKLLKDPEHRSSDENAIYEDLQFMSDFEIHSLCKKYKVLKDHCLPKERILSSGKFKQLDDLLPTMKKKGDKVLLFSQFTMVLDIVEVYMEERNHKYLRLDGSTPVIERQELIDQFSEDDDIFVFLLSTKAGGMGINLVAANVVILHDIDFNPYNDKQAEDRCHRVGQTRDVTLYRLIGKNTIEEAMLKCAQEKLKLEREVTSTSADEEMNSGDVASMLKEALKMK